MLGLALRVLYFLSRCLLISFDKISQEHMGVVLGYVLISLKYCNAIVSVLCPFESDLTRLFEHYNKAYLKTRKTWKSWLS